MAVALRHPAHDLRDPALLRSLGEQAVDPEARVWPEGVSSYGGRWEGLMAMAAARGMREKLTVLRFALEDAVTLLGLAAIYRGVEFVLERLFSERIPQEFKLLEQVLLLLILGMFLTSTLVRAWFHLRSEYRQAAASLADEGVQG